MESFVARNSGRVIVLRLDPGDYLLESIRACIQQENIQDAYVASGIGTLDHCIMHMVMTTSFPPVEHFERWEDKPLEVVSIAGVIAASVPHLHMTVSDHEKAYAGHLEEGCRILYLGEVVIVELENAGFKRVRSEKGILKLVNH